MTSCVFAFGPGDQWFMESPATWKWGTLPPAIHQRFTSANGETVKHVHALVFGANGSYMMTWLGADGKDYQAHSGLPADLANWLDQKDSNGFLTRNVRLIRLALGPDNFSFFVTDGKNYLWKNLPAGLNSAIEGLRKSGGGFTFAPRLVTLGVGGSYVMVTAGNGGSWDLAAQYPQLETYLVNLKTAHGNRGGMFASIAYISLDGFDPGHYVITTTTGGYHAEAPDECIGDLDLVLQSIPKAATARAPVQQQQQQQRKSNRSSVIKGIGGMLKLTNAVLKAANGGGGGGFDTSGFSGGDGGGGGGFDYTQTTMDFTQGLQDQTWNSVDSTAANWNVQ